jgi:hypothetical protein
MMGYSATDFVDALAEFEARSLIDGPARQAYLSRCGLLEILPTIADRFGPVVTTNIELADDGPSWGFSDRENGFPAAVMEVRERIDGPDPEAVDLIAWRADDPFAFWLMFGNASALGADNITDPGTYVWNAPLSLHRTPLAWLQGGCRGAVILYEHDIGRLLNRAPGNVACEDRDHALAVARMACTKSHPFMSPERIGFIARAAA